MGVGEQPYVTDRADAIEFEPESIDGAEIGEVHRLRTEGAHEACLWRTDAPATYDYLFPGDESFIVLEGSATIELLDSGERVEVKEGDNATFDGGTRSVWTFTEPFKKFTVISH